MALGQKPWMWSLSPLDVWTSLCSKSSFSASFLANWIEWLGMTPWYAGGAAPGALNLTPGATSGTGAGGGSCGAGGGGGATGSAAGKFWTLITTGGAAWRDGQTPMAGAVDSSGSGVGLACQRDGSGQGLDRWAAGPGLTQEVVKPLSQTGYGFLHKSYDFLHNSYDFLYNSYDFLRYP